MYLNARYISASESIWRIFHYRMHNHTPNIQRLAVHLPNQQTVTFQDGENLQNIINQATARMTTLTAWFKENSENTAAHVYKYADFPLIILGISLSANGILEKLQQEQLEGFIWSNLQKEKDTICESC